MNISLINWPWKQLLSFKGIVDVMVNSILQYYKQGEASTLYYIGNYHEQVWVQKQIINKYWVYIDQYSTVLNTPNPKLRLIYS